MYRFRSDAGAAAVEFALVLPILILLAIGIAEFGRLYNIQNSLSAAAREGVRIVALGNASTVTGGLTTATLDSAPSLDNSRGTVTTQVCSGPPDKKNPPTCTTTAVCTTGQTAVLTINYTYNPIGYIPGVPEQLQGIGVMRCGG